MQLAPDLTIIFQIAIFIVVWLGLKKLAFEPTQRVLAERDRRTIQAAEHAVQLEATAHADRARYDDALREQRHRMAHEAETARHAAIEESNQQIAAARAAIAHDLSTQRAAVASQVDTARRALAAEANTVADEMLRQVAGGAPA
ncbi:MAG: hypothetical protein ACRERC_10260 [Candidatus Binatia bacterium]